MIRQLRYDMVYLHVLDLRAPGGLSRPARSLAPTHALASAFWGVFRESAHLVVTPTRLRLNPVSMRWMRQERMHTPASLPRKTGLDAADSWHARHATCSERSHRSRLPSGIFWCPTRLPALLPPFFVLFFFFSFSFLSPSSLASFLQAAGV
ncbi:uncharacterized protein LY79DRAFT_13374 [Colletotrichum navitas]|uniref:Uncharacterized protein n=1 Tax=Colletotrichum navitas TaxID=681940 RepID=A0AAD8VD76_9PEZI|nr:uncharacterized protein LY79DRAFT_13374 [Colletotrichum navitas]KAK1600290.1 hypothetical protein LY79DRAFT_13374 [Colletotrichum navitas]